MASPASTSPSCETSAAAGPAAAAAADAVAVAVAVAAVELAAAPFMFTFDPTLAPWDCGTGTWNRPSPRPAFFACSRLRAPRSSSDAVEVTLATKRAGGKERPMAVMHASALPR